MMVDVVDEVAGGVGKLLDCFAILTRLRFAKCLFECLMARLFCRLIASSSLSDASSALLLEELISCDFIGLDPLRVGDLMTGVDTFAERLDRYDTARQRPALEAEASVPLPFLVYNVCCERLPPSR